MKDFVALVDMDGVVVDIETRLNEYVAEKFPNAVLTNPDAWKIEDRYDTVDDRDLTPLFYSERFFLDLPVIEGAYEGVERLSEVADVWFCSTPKNSLYCSGEKTAWIDKYFPDFVRKLILTKDKTFVRGDILIDDKPEITGRWHPTWKHVLYGPTSFTWADIDGLCEKIRTGMVQ